MNLVNPYILAPIPTNTVAPVISGTGSTGNTLTLISNGTWTNSPLSYTYQWNNNGHPILGATSSTLLLGDIEVGNDVTCSVTAINATGSGRAASNSISVAFPSSSALGSQFTDTFNRSSPGSNYNVTAPDVTFSQNGSNLRAARATTGGFVNYMILNAFPSAGNGMLAESITFTTRFFIVTHAVGIGIGFKSLSGNSVVDFLAIANTAPSAAGYCSQYHNGTEVSSRSSPLVSWAAGDHVELSINRNINIMTITMKRLNGTTFTRTSTYTFSTTGSPLAMNVSQLCVWFFGGTYDFDYLNITYGLSKYPGLAFIGNSITQWYFNSIYQNRYASQSMTGSSKSYVVMAGQGMRTADLLLALDEIRVVRPQYVIMMIGTNDYGTSVPEATFKANYEQLISTLIGYGIRQVVLLLITPRNTINFNPATAGTANKWINDTYSGDSRVVIVDTYTDLKAAVGDGINASYSSDGLHPNDTGSDVIKTKIRGQIPTILGI